MPVFDSLLLHLPAPRQSPTNARLALQEGEPNPKFVYLGAMTFSVSTREILLRFFADNADIHFVAVFTITQRLPHPSRMKCKYPAP